MTDNSIDSLAAKRGGDDGGKQVGKILDTCANKGAVNIGVYWSAQVGNPEALTMDELFQDCAALAGYPGILSEYQEPDGIVLNFWSGKDTDAILRAFPPEVQRCIQDPFNAYYEFRQAKQD